MAKNLKLLLTENVDSLGIVGDVVNVRVGYARNFLLPRDMATTPSDEAIAAVAAKRAEAQRELAALRQQREGLVEKMSGAHITLVRSCNELGHLYASITQQEIATALHEAGFPGVRPRDVRLNQSIKRVDNYDVHIKFDTDLDATVKLTVNPDRKLELRHDEPAPAEVAAPQGADGQAAPQGAAGAAAPATTEARPEGKARREKGEGKGEKSEKSEKGEAKDKPAREKPEAGEARPEKEAREKKPRKEGGKGKEGKEGKEGADAAPSEKKSGGGWGTPVSKPDFGLPPVRRGRR
ncbi:MAG: 50S ribosomal protein L9 [Phycisphaerales bacterium]